MNFYQVFFAKRLLSHDCEKEHGADVILRKPEDIIDAVERSKESGDHSEIHHILDDRNINLSKSPS